MKLKQNIIFAILFLIAALPAMAKSSQNVVKKVYMFGLAASFNDTIVHMTEIQAVDSAWIGRSSGFLLGREEYAIQLRSYLASQQLSYRTCVIFFDKKLNRLQKKYLKTKKLYVTDSKKKNTSRNALHTIALNDFKFSPVNMSGLTEEDVQAINEKKEQKKAKKERKAKEKKLKKNK